jgi:sugar O-acyltransferase (sialic acid O-acetyltransferase NeuD family)
MVTSQLRSPTPVLIGLVGAGGFGRTVMPVVHDQVARLYESSNVSIVFVESEPSAAHINGVPCVSVEDFFGIPCRERLFNVAISHSRLRQKLADTFIDKGAKPLPIHAESASIGATNDIAEGSVFCHLSTVTVNARIGRFFHGHLYSYVEHDCVIGDFVTFAPRVSCNGNVHIGNHAYIGTGAVIRQGTPDQPLVIGEGAVVGMGAVVTKDVEPFTTVVGNPARPLEK